MASLNWNLLNHVALWICDVSFSDDALFNYYMYACSDDALFMYACSDDALGHVYMLFFFNYHLCASSPARDVLVHSYPTLQRGCILKGVPTLIYVFVYTCMCAV